MEKNKGAIIVDIPEGCLYCNFAEAVDFFHGKCTLIHEEFLDVAYDDDRMENCPIIEKPKKIRETSEGNYLAKDLLAYGWNSCIDKIFREEKKDEQN